MKFKLVLIMFILSLQQIDAQSFRAEQLKYERVRTSYAKKEHILLDRYKLKGFQSLSNQIFLRAFKESSELELWVKDTKSKKFILIHTYSICAKSGELGPKREEGDGQVPEGFYSIERFNPVSNYYISLGVSYPNSSDRILGNKKHLGGDIFIHGNCVTIGCLPLTDAFIMEVYIACVEARNNGQKVIPVHIFPYRMTTKEHLTKCNQHKINSKLCLFWNNLKQGYDFFEQKKTLPIVTTDKQGRYLIK
ncbi:MAG: hypothetical protein WCP69_09725 [Bacteroidota bacterium]